jgi:adenylate cyclase class 2
MTEGGIETEVKLPVPDPATALRLIQEAGFTESAPRVFEVNVVYDTPEESVRARGELLRLRRAGDRNVLTWKGVAVPGRHKSRPEDEVAFDDFDALERILGRLGYSPVFRYEKYRTEFTKTPGSGTLTLDETPIGTYVELEGPASWIDQVARHLGFSEQAYITASYGSLYLTHCERTGVTPAWMVFG